MFTDSTRSFGKNLLLIAIMLVAIIYALPNLYTEKPAIELSRSDNAVLPAQMTKEIEIFLSRHQLKPSYEKPDNSHFILSFSDTDAQLKAKDLLEGLLGDQYTIALNLRATTPAWLKFVNANPMKLGLDLRGGIHFTLRVDLDSVLEQRFNGLEHNIGEALREENIRYTNLEKQGLQNLLISFNTQSECDQARGYLSNHFRDFTIQEINQYPNYALLLSPDPEAVKHMREVILEQTMTTLRNRVNELGISEATVQQTGLQRISIEMPGVLDSAHAKQILGGTATLDFHMVDTLHNPQNLSLENILGSTVYQYENAPILLKNQVILSGNSITDAQATTDEAGRPAVNISLGGGGEALFHHTTALNVGKPMAIVYVESKIINKPTPEGKLISMTKKDEKVISVATIRSALANDFQITGLGSMPEAQNLALLLRAGALPATVNIIEERTLGPKLGLENIRKGIISIEAGMVIVILFMAFYYSLFGLIANIGLICNLILLIALLSALGMTLTLPGMAGIVLTVGLAVDANVLIFERIREELRHGASPHAAIHSGYNRAFATIVDANVTTFIVGLVLFGVGTGPIKGFAITLVVGIVTSMISAVAITRALVNALYAQRKVKKIAIGI